MIVIVCVIISMQQSAAVTTLSYKLDTIVELLGNLEIAFLFMKHCTG